MNKTIIEKTVEAEFPEDYWTEQDFYTILENIVERVFDYDETEGYEENIGYAIDDELIYYADQWIVLKHYFIDPKLANFEGAIDQLYCDVSIIVDKLIERIINK